MKTFTVRFKLGENVTTHPVKARTVIGAIIEAHAIIKRNFTSDNRIDRGDVEILDGKNIVYQIKGDIENLGDIEINGKIV